MDLCTRIKNKQINDDVFYELGEKQTKMKWREKIFKDLQLILDWNRPDMALSMIFHRDDWGKVKVCCVLFINLMLIIFLFCIFFVL
jgi:hypothetical protein